MKEKINIVIAGAIETDTGRKTATLAEQIIRLSNVKLKAIYNRNYEIVKSILNNRNLQSYNDVFCTVGVHPR